MLAIFEQTLPFFALIACGYGAGRIGFFNEQATAYLTKFVFYFALSAMIFRFTSELDITTFWDINFALAYLLACLSVYAIFKIVALVRGTGWEVAAFEAQCSVIGNTGFLGLPMLAALLGPAAVAPSLFVLAIDLIVFSTIIVVSVTAAREGRVTAAALMRVALSIVQNPMIVAMAAGLAWGASGWEIYPPIKSFIVMLGGASTPCALFAIGASLAVQRADRVVIPVWLSLGKLGLHPLAVFLFAFVVFPVEPFAAGIMLLAAAMPVAGNIYILADHFGVATQRVSSAILISHVIAVITLSAMIAWVVGQG